VQAILKPIKFLVIPLKFFVERVLVVSCLNYEAKQSTQGRLGMASQQSQRFSAFSSRSKALSSKSKKVPSKSKKLLPRHNLHNHGDEDEFGGDTVGFSVKQPSAPAQSEEDMDGPAPMSITEKLQAGGGLTKRNKAVSFRSTKIALDENYKDELDHDQAEFSLSTKIMEYTAK